MCFENVMINVILTNSDGCMVNGTPGILIQFLFPMPLSEPKSSTAAISPIDRKNIGTIKRDMIAS